MPQGKSGSSKTLKKVLIPVISVAVVAAVALSVYLIFLSSSPMATATRALINVGNEIETRTEGTPLELFGLLTDSFSAGTVSVDFDYSDRWSDSKGIITLHSDEEQGEYAAEIDMTVENTNVELDVYFNREMAAMRIKQLDNNYYGIVFDTFRDDFRAFANFLELDREEVDEVVRFVEMIADMLRASGDTSALTGEYGKLLKGFLENINAKTERVQITSGGSNIRVEKIEFTATDRDIIKLLEDLLDVIADDENIRAVVESFASGALGFIQYDDIIREIRRELQTMARNLSGEIVMSMFIGRSNRLLRVEIDADLVYAGEGNQVGISLDFGASASDIWVFEMTMGSGRDSMTFTAEWEMKESARSNETVLRFFPGSSSSSDEKVEVILSWTDRGNFTLSTEANRSSETILTGVYTRNSDGFVLAIDDPFVDSYWDESLSLTISASSRAGEIKEVDFINISEWGSDFVERIEEIFASGDTAYTPPTDISPPPTDTPNPPSLDLPILDSELLGGWEFVDGEGTYFFWRAEMVVFTEEGYVIADDEYGTWTVSGNRLTVKDDFGEGNTYEFTFVIVDDVLSITDSDSDTGRFKRLW